jgi:hypothetical protein
MSGITTSRMTAWGLAFLFACAITGLPFFVLSLDSDRTSVLVLQWIGKCLTIPGVLVGILAAGGNGHLSDYRIVIAANGLFYTLVFYRLFARLCRRRAAIHAPIKPQG